MFKKNRKEKGVTLVALVVTIIVLIIIAGITVYTLINNGLIENANRAKNLKIWAQAENEISLIVNEVQIEKLGNATLIDVVKKLEENKDNIYLVRKKSKFASLSEDGIKTATELDGTESIIYVTNLKYECEIAITKTMGIIVTEDRKNIKVSLEEEIEKLKEELAELEKEYEEKLANLKKDSDEIQSELQASGDEKQKKINELNAQITSLNNQIAGLKQQITDLNNEKTKLIADANSKIAKLEEENKKLKESAKNYRTVSGTFNISSNTYYKTKSDWKNNKKTAMELDKVMTATSAESSTEQYYAASLPIGTAQTGLKNVEWITLRCGFAFRHGTGTWCWPNNFTLVMSDYKGKTNGKGIFIESASPTSDSYNNDTSLSYLADKNSSGFWNIKFWIEPYVAGSSGTMSGSVCFNTNPTWTAYGY